MFYFLRDVSWTVCWWLVFVGLSGMVGLWPVLVGYIIESTSSDVHGDDCVQFLTAPLGLVGAGPFQFCFSHWSFWYRCKALAEAGALGVGIAVTISFSTRSPFWSILFLELKSMFMALGSFLSNSPGRDSSVPANFPDKAYWCRASAFTSQPLA